MKLIKNPSMGIFLIALIAAFVGVMVLRLSLSW
jgi:hypothetical protein